LRVQGFNGSAVRGSETILSLFRSCFDGRGNFQKLLFEKQVPELARYPKKIFAVLWEFLKEMPRRADQPSRPGSAGFRLGGAGAQRNRGSAEGRPPGRRRTQGPLASALQHQHDRLPALSATPRG
jgi:hypothetical protein